MRTTGLGCNFAGKTVPLVRMYLGQNSNSFLSSGRPLKALWSPNRRQMSQSTGSGNESGSFALNVFLGKLKSDFVFPFPEVCTTEQIEDVRTVIEGIAKSFEQFDFAKYDERGGLDEEGMDFLREYAAWGMQAPTKYGGFGFNNTQYARLSQHVGAFDLGVCVTLGAHQSIGYKGIVLFGTEEQKEKYVPDLSVGKKFAAFALTEPSSGSDAASIRTKAVLSDDGSHYVMNGSKSYISNGGFADVFTVFAQVPVKDSRTGLTKNKVTAFIVERDFGGVTSGPPEKKIGIRTSNTTEVFFDDVRIPKENLLGGEGNGFKVAMNILNSGRFVISSLMSGTMRLCIEKATEQAGTRAQFGRTLDGFEGIQEKIARMVMNHYVAESMAFVLSGAMDRGAKDFQIEAAISKVFASEAAWNTVDETMQIFGGGGYMKDTGIEKILRDVRIFRIFEGANEILRLLIALTGVQYAGGHLKELQKAFKNPAANLGVVMSEGSRRALRMMGVKSSKSSSVAVNPELQAQGKLLTQSIENIGATVEKLLIQHGKGIIEAQYALNRLANCTIDAYSMAVILSRASRSIERGHPSAQHEINICKVFCQESEQRIRQWLKTIEQESSADEKIFPLLSSVSKDVVKNRGIIHQNPLGF